MMQKLLKHQLQIIIFISYVETLESNKTKSINKFKELTDNKLEELTVIEEGNYKGIINNKTGDITHEFYNEFGKIIDSYTTNFYENIESISEDFDISTYKTIAQNSIPYKLNSQHYTIGVYGGKITSAAMIAALKALGFGALVGSAVKLTSLYNKYSDMRVDADHLYNAL